MVTFLQEKKILLVVAHPDDELLGVGGTMNRLIKDYNCTVKVIILGEGLTSRRDKRELAYWNNELKKHQENIEKAQQEIGYQELAIYNFPDNRFDSVDLLDIIKVIEKEKQLFQPEIIFTHHGGDLNIDHQRTCEAVITACRPIEDEIVSSIICFETPSGTEWRSSADPKHFIPNFFVEISEYNLNTKIKGMECYEFEKRQYPHPRSPEALKVLAQRWGILIGRKYAEAFMLIRLIQ